jgi:hypothetical protein
MAIEPSPCSGRHPTPISPVFDPWNSKESDMGSTLLLTLAGAVRRGFRHVFGRLARGTAPRIDLRPLATTRLHTAAGRGHVAWPQRDAKARPLRVLRVVDAMHGPSSAGRMVISGRMADVCAELDRLAALEGAAAA